MTVADFIGASPRIHEAIVDSIIRRSERLRGLSHAVHEQQELGFEEHRSVELVAALLRTEGHECAIGQGGLATSLRATAGTGTPRVAVLAEYDALPGIGHGCGHNIICACAVGAFLGLADHVAETGGSVVLLGTPAEENGGGKELLARTGAFDGVDAALMLHPTSGQDVVDAVSLGCRGVRVSYHGQAAHASASPQDGRNALDALVTAYNGISALRQHIPDTDRMHMIITEGGAAVNVVPDLTRGLVQLRSATAEGLAALSGRLQGVLEGAARLTGTRLEADWDPIPPYLPLRTNTRMARRFAGHLTGRGRPTELAEPGNRAVGGSTDMGNISVRIPSIHPMLGIAPAGTPLHTADFADHAAAPSSDDAVIDGAVALAATAADLLCDAGLRESVRDEFEESGGAVDVVSLLSTSECAPGQR